MKSSLPNVLAPEYRSSGPTVLVTVNLARVAPVREIETGVVEISFCETGNVAKVELPVQWPPEDEASCFTWMRRTCRVMPTTSACAAAK